MEKLDLRWPVFEYCNHDLNTAFENMCRRLFTAKYLKEQVIPHTDHNTPGIEVVPVLEPEREDGQPPKLISFQSKYHGSVSDAYRKFKESAEKTVKCWRGKLDVVYLFSNQTLTTTSNQYKDVVGILNAAGIEAIPITNTDLLDLVAEFPKIAKDYFKAPDDKAGIPLTLTTIPEAIDLIGREEDIQNIRELLKQNKIISIYADGGVGKTAVAAKIVEQIKNEILAGVSDYKHVAWITSTGNLKDDLTMLDVPSIAGAASQEAKYRAANVFLQNTPTFLIIDNLDKIPTRDEVSILTTIAGRTIILITTRVNIRNLKKHELENLDPESALILFYQHYKGMDEPPAKDYVEVQQDRSYAQSIVEKATYNALFIELIGGMAYADHWELRKLWEKLQEDVFGQDSRYVLHAGYGGDGRLLDHIQKLYEMSNLTDRQKEILSFIALFPSEYSIFFDAFKWAGFENDEEDNLGELVRRGWIVRDEDGYLIHTLVKGSVTLQNGKTFFDEVRYEKLIEKLANVKQYLAETMEYTKICERIIVPETICKLLAVNRSETRCTSALFNNIANVYHARGNYKKAMEYLEKDCVICENTLGTNHLETSLTYNNMANVYVDMGEYDEALKYYGKALSIIERAQVTEQPVAVMTYNNMANVCCFRGNYEKALGYYKKAQDICEKVQGKDQRSTATMYINIASVYQKLGDYEKALDFSKKALNIDENVLGKDHPSTATTYINIASVYQKLGDYEKALDFSKKALNINEKVLGKDHPSTAVAYNNIAAAYNALGECEIALKYYRKAFEVFEKVLGKEHLYTKTTKRNIDRVKRR